VRTLPRLHLNLRTADRSGELVLRTSNLRVGFPDKFLFQAPDIVLRRGECAALIGPNGAGKTTFLKTILEHVPPLQGEVTLGASLNVGYFAQAHEDLDPERTLVEEIDSVAPNMLLAAIRDYLAKFLFTGDDVFKKVSVLSGGEGSRLALAKLALTNANLLLLDEPTNHLDIPSQEILQEVLDNYQGTILLVSHDRYLIDALATQIWEIDETKGILAVFKGSYSQYREWQVNQRERARAEEGMTIQKNGGYPIQAYRLLAHQRGRKTPPQPREIRGRPDCGPRDPAVDPLTPAGEPARRPRQSTPAGQRVCESTRRIGK
jgi:ATP-binding cassette subfamily F protein 3